MATQLMMNGVTTYEDVRVVDAVIDEMEIGIFVNSARLTDQVLRDARIFSTLGTRLGGFLGKPLEFEEAEGYGVRKDSAARAAKDLETDWYQLCRTSSLYELHAWALMHNTGIAQIIEETDPWTLDVWHPWALQWDEYERVYYVQTREDSRLYIRPDGKGGYRDQNGTRWVLHTPWGHGNTRRNYLRCLHRLSNERQWSHRDRSRFSEIFGQGIRLGIAPELATDEEVKTYKRSLRLGGEPVIVARQGPEGRKWGLELIQANGRSSDLFDTTLTQLDREIATLFLGQSQTTDGQAGLGSNDQAGEPVRVDLMRLDSESLSSTLREQLLKPYWEFAYGRAELAPWPCWRVEPPEDRAKKATQFKLVMDGIVAAKAAGVPIDERALLEDFGIPAISEAEQAAIEAEKQAQAAPAAPATPGGKPETPPMTPAPTGA